MAIRSFVCACGLETELDQPIDTITYPKCSCGREMKHRINPNPIIFKGNGWAKKG